MPLNHCWPSILITLLIFSSTCVTNRITSSYLEPHGKSRLLILRVSRSDGTVILGTFVHYTVTISDALFSDLTSTMSIEHARLFGPAITSF
ncbi:hypothetical protein BJX65DRAFT_276216 [Aspergillus insuetus]